MMSDRNNGLLNDVLIVGNELSGKLNEIGVSNTFGKASEGKDDLISLIRMAIDGIDMVVDENSYISLTATNPYMLTGETTDVVAKLRNGVCRPLNNKIITMGQSVFVDNGTTGNHNDWDNVASTMQMTRQDTYTELKRTENASSFGYILKELSVTDGITIEFDLKQATPSSSNDIYLTFRDSQGNTKLLINRNYENLNDGEWHHYKFDVNGLTVTPTIDGVQKSDLTLSDSWSRIQLEARNNAVQHFKNFVIYNNSNGVTDENGEFALYDISDDTIFTATYGTETATCLVEYCDFVDYAVTNNKNNNWYNNTGGTITVDDRGTTFTAVPHSNGTHWTCGYCPASTTSRNPFNYPIIVEFDILRWDTGASIWIKSDLGNRTSFNRELNHVGSRARIEIGTTSTKIYIDGAFVSEKTYTQPSSYGIELGFYANKSDYPTAPSLKFANFTIKPL